MQNQETLKTLQGRVEYILKEYPATRNSDLELQAQFAQNFYPSLTRVITSWYEIVMLMKDIPSLDHIARVRRKIIEHYKYEKYLPTSYEVAKARGIQEDVWRTYGRQKQQPSSGIQNIPQGHRLADMRDEL